mgnify:FL=1
MARKKTIKAEQILDKAYEIVLTDGLKSITARKLATALNCSTQPIYLEFGSMSELKQAVLEQAKARLIWYVSEEQHHDDALVNLGVGYIRFATVEPELYRALFIDNHFGAAETRAFVNQVTDIRLHDYQPLQRLTKEQQQQVVNEIWITMTGFATLINAHLVQFDEESASTQIGVMLMRCFELERV